MQTMTFDREDGKRRGGGFQEGRIIVDFQRKYRASGVDEICFTLERIGPDRYETMSRFTAADVPRLACVLRAIAGYYAISDELDPATVSRMQTLFDRLSEFMGLPIRRLELDGGCFGPLKLVPSPT